MTLRNHLSADQDPRLPIRHTRDHGLELVAPSHYVAIESRDSDARERFDETFFDTLRALSHRLHGVAALRALTRQVSIGAAMMTAQPSGLSIDGHARIAGLAGCDPATGRAGECGCVAASIDIHEDLTVRREVALNGGHGGSRQSGVNAFLAQVDETQGGRQGRCGTIG